MTLNSEPTRGPDPANPLNPFAGGDVYFQLVVAPALLPIKPLVLAETGVGFFNALVGLIWEDAVWELMLRLDRRYKVAVLRRNRAGDIGKVVNLELTSSHDAAMGICAATLTDWHAGSTYRDRRPMRAKDIRRAIRSSRREAG